MITLALSRAASSSVLDLEGLVERRTMYPMELSKFRTLPEQQRPRNRLQVNPFTIRHMPRNSLFNEIILTTTMVVFFLEKKPFYYKAGFVSLNTEVLTSQVSLSINCAQDYPGAVLAGDLDEDEITSM